MNKVRVGYVKLDERAEIPEYQTVGAAGCDLKACLDRPIPLWAGHTKLIPTGLSIEIPDEFEGQVRSRSGMALKNGIVVLNSPGTIDSDYRGPLGVILHNTNSIGGFEITHGMRIAQLVITPVVQANFEEGFIEKDTERGAGGFGSTGK